MNILLAELIKTTYMKKIDDFYEAKGALVADLNEIFVSLGDDEKIICSSEIVDAVEKLNQALED